VLSLVAMGEPARIGESPYLESTPGVCGGRARIRGTRIRISEIAWRYVYAGEAPDEILEAHPQLTLAQLHAALSYYYARRDEIDEELRADDARVAEMLRRYAPDLSRA